MRGIAPVTIERGVWVDARAILDTLAKDRQCTYNVPFKRSRATIFAVKETKVLRILSVCLYP